MSMMRVMKSRNIPQIINWMIRRVGGLSTASMRTLPDFIIIGAQRCGTTSLYQYLGQHPEAYPSFPKEIHYFSNYFHRGINWYRSHFPPQRQKIKVNANAGGKFITGEATPYYLFHPLAPRRASQVVPKARLIILLRDPVKRAYSHYYHEVNMGVETLTFEEAINAEEERLDGELEKLTADETYRSFNYQHFSYLARGIYIDQIQRWTQYFPSESLLILNSDQFNLEPAGTFKQVAAFLGLSNYAHIDFSRYHAASYPKMDQAISEKLNQYFLPHNQRLFELTGIDLNTGGHI